MKVEPSAADLLETARAAIVSQVAPALTGPQRYAALMAANAMAIAAREIAAAPDSSGEIARLATLLPGWTPSGDGAADLRDGTARLAARIRAGEFAAQAAQARLLAHLGETTRARLAISNPRALAR